MKKFTLIELLVVIAIIGILASMLLPSLAKSRIKALQTVCLSNQKQVGIASLSYIIDNSEFAPTDSASTDTPGLPWWYARMIPSYLPYGTKAEQDPTGNQIAPSDVQICPSGRQDLKRWDSTISMNSHINGDVWGDQPPITMATSDETMMLMDSHIKFRSSWTTGFTLEKMIEIDEQERIARHLDKAVVTFLDGHAKAIHYSNLLSKSDPTDTFWDPRQ